MDQEKPHHGKNKSCPGGLITSDSWRSNRVVMYSHLSVWPEVRRLGDVGCVQISGF